MDFEYSKIPDLTELTRHLTNLIADDMDLPSLDEDQARKIIQHLFLGTLPAALQTIEGEARLHGIGRFRHVAVPERTYAHDFDGTGIPIETVVPAHSEVRFTAYQPMIEALEID